MDYEVGIIKASPAVYALRMLKTIWRTWRHARAAGLPANEWYGVYERGSENAVAHFGCLPGAHDRAAVLVKNLSQ